MGWKLSVEYYTDVGDVPRDYLGGSSVELHPIYGNPSQSDIIAALGKAILVVENIHRDIAGEIAQVKVAIYKEKP
jgi:hypothetical protein